MPSELRVPTSRGRLAKRRVETGIFDAVLVRSPTIGARGYAQWQPRSSISIHFTMGLLRGRERYWTIACMLCTQAVDRAIGFMRTGTSFGITFLSNRCARTELSAGAGRTQGEKPEFRLRWASSSRAFCCSNCRNLRSIGSIAKLSVAKSQQAAQW